MAAPVVALRYSIGFRDSKGFTSRMRFLIGDATVTAINTDANALVVLLQAVSNAHAYRTDLQTPDHTYGTTAQYATTEDKAELTFLDQQGKIHRFQVPAPKAAGFNTDTETVLSSETNMGNLITGISTYVYGSITDTSPMTYVSGVRVRRRLVRKATGFTKDPTLGIPEE